MTAGQTQAAAVSFSFMPDKLAAIIYLLNSNNMTAEQIQAAATPFSMMPDKWAAIVYLLSTGGAGGAGGTTFGNYAGGQPNFTPAGGTGLAVDTSNGTLWEYYSGAWH